MNNVHRNNKREEHFVDLFHNQKVTTFSFDVFDTVLTRTTAEPVGIFFLIQKKLTRENHDLPKELLRRFVSFRCEAERNARAKKFEKEVTLPDIYRELGVRFGLSDSFMEMLMTSEIEQELRSVVTVPLIRDLISNLRQRGKRIIFISDMYLPEDAIRRMLQKAEVYKDGDGLYVSSGPLETKSTGRLFSYVLQQERCAPEEMLHIGDHLSHDYKIPISLGIKAMHFRQSHLTRYERALLGTSRIQGKKGLYWQRLSGASRLTRLSTNYSSDPEQAIIYQIGANLAGPILLGFVYWTIKEACSRNVKRLYFLSRDGQVLLHIAERILLDHPFNIELRYLYASRRSWHLPSIRSIGERELKLITLPEPLLSLQIVAQRLGLTTDLLMEHLSGAGFHVKDINRELSSFQISSLQDILRYNPSLYRVILEQADCCKKLTHDYLRQEGLMDGIPWAIVDVGWYGNLQDSLSRILDADGQTTKLRGFYFGLRNRRLDTYKVPFFFGPGFPLVYKIWGKAIANIMEILTAANHGSTICYERAGDKIVPRLNGELNERAITWGLAALRDGIDAFLNHSIAHLHEIDMQEYRERILSLVKLLVSSPAKEEAKMLGKYSFSSDQSEAISMPFAPPLKLKDIAQCLIGFDFAKLKNLTLWPEGSIVQSNLPGKMVFFPRMARFAVNMLNFLSK